MSNPQSGMFGIDDIDQSFLPDGKFNPDDETHINLVIEHFRREGGADGLFTDVRFDGLVIQINTNDSAQKELDDCIELLQLGGYRPALHRLKPLIDQYPTHVHLLYNYGMALREVGEVDSSIDMLKRATEVAPSHVQSWVALSVSYQTVGRQEEALAAVQQAYQRDKDDLFVLRTLGYLLELSGDPDKATIHLERALILSPQDAQTHLVLGKIKSSTDAAQAKSHLEKVLQLAPGSALASVASSLLDKV